MIGLLCNIKVVDVQSERHTVIKTLVSHSMICSNDHVAFSGLCSVPKWRHDTLVPWHGHGSIIYHGQTQMSTWTMQHWRAVTSPGNVPWSDVQHYVAYFKAMGDTVTRFPWELNYQANLSTDRSRIDERWILSGGWGMGDWINGNPGFTNISSGF